MAKSFLEGKSGTHLVKLLSLSLKLTEPEYLQWLMDIHILLMGSFLVHCRRAWSRIYFVALTNSPAVVFV